MNCCHLDITMKNILIQNGDFIKSSDGKSVSINPSINIKLGDFGLAEIFKNNKNFDCCKYNAVCDYEQYQSPEVYNGDIYDARKSDIYSLGIILFTMAVGVPPYKIADHKIDCGYHAIQQNKIECYLKYRNYFHLFSSKMISMISGLLKYDAYHRFDILQIITHEWLQKYYITYRDRISKKSKLQKKINKYRLNKQDGLLSYYW